MNRVGNKLMGTAAFLLMAALPVFSASDTAITLSVEPNVIRLNESAMLKLNFINLNPPQAPAAPEIPGFSVTYNGQESHFEIINGQQSRRISFNYQLVPQATGKYSIGPFTMDVGGEKKNLHAVELEVLPAANTTAGPAGQTMSDLIFARVLLPRDKVYLQERFDVELLLYYRGIQLDRGLQLQNLPSTGLNLDNFEEIGSSREVVNNEIYQVRRFRMRGTAISSGTIELMPMVRVNVLVRRERNRDPFFGGLFGMQDSEALSVPTKPISVSILALPKDNKPNNFSGAVGNFNMNVEVNPMECSAGDPVTLTLRITGNGNFESISMPPLSLGDDFRAYDPKLLDVGSDHKIFEQVFIPRTDTITEIPPVSFTYFDPDAAQYKTISKGPITITVHPGSSGAQQIVQAPSALPAAAKDPLGIDIIDLKRDIPEWNTTPVSRLPGLTTVATHALPVFAIAFMALFLKKRDAINRDVTRRRRTMAPKTARAAIRKAESALSAGDTTGFYESVWQAMADYVGHRANLEPGEVSPTLILNRTERGGLAKDKHDALKEILAACDESRFASINTQDQDSLQNLLSQTQDILRACERIDF